MDIEILARNVHIHQHYAEAFQQQLAALWQRKLLDSEIQIIRNFTLCESAMGLESTDMALHYATGHEKADEQFSFMETLVAQRIGALTALLYKFAHQTRWTNSSEFSDLLSWEQAILDDLRR